MKTRQFLAILFIILAFFNVSSSQQELKLITKMTGENHGDRFGTGLAAGDFNEDGYSDVLIGAGRWNNTTGRDYLYYGSEIMDNNADMIFTGDSPGDGFDFSIANVGDVNRDGVEDFLIPAPGFNSHQGKVEIFYGSASLDTLPDVIIIGKEKGNEFGHPVSGAGDVNGDGFDDILVVSWVNGVNKPDQIFLYFGGSPMDTIPDWVLLNAGPIYADGVGVGDVNGDGYDDVLIKSQDTPTRLYFGGAEMDTVADVTFYGAETIGGAGDLNEDGFDDIVIAFHFRSGGPLGTHVFFGSAQMDTTPDISLLKHTGTPVGTRDLSHGDINGDGYQDILIGSVLSFGTGALYVYLGGPGVDGVPEVAILGSNFGNGFGSVVSSAGDVNGDGVDDVLVSNTEYWGNRGEVYLFSGDSTLHATAVEEVGDREEGTPKGFHLSQNYPNPFNSSTKIGYQIPDVRYQPRPSTIVTLWIYNLLGQEIRTLVREEQKPGSYEVVWNGKDKEGKEVSNGIYFYQLKAGDFVKTKKLILLR